MPRPYLSQYLSQGSPTCREPPTFIQSNFHYSCPNEAYIVCTPGPRGPTGGLTLHEEAPR